MRITTGTLAVVATVMVAGVGAVGFGIGGWRLLGSGFSDDASTGATITEIRVSGHSGLVVVGPGDGSRIDVYRSVRYLRPLRRRPGVTHRIDGEVLYLDTNCGRFCQIEYTVRAPAGVRVTGALTSGGFRLADVSAVDVRTSSGTISVDRAVGDVRLRSSSGKISGAALRSARVEATSSSGAVRLDLVDPGDARVVTSSGGVRLTVPAGGYRVDARSGGAGKVKVGVVDDPSGRYHLDLRSDSGDVTVAARH